MCGVDWSSLGAGSKYYVPLLKNTHFVAEYVTEFIRNLEEAGVRAENIAIAGHSVGAHVAGFVGKHFIAQGQQLAKIYG